MQGVFGGSGGLVLRKGGGGGSGETVGGEWGCWGGVIANWKAGRAGVRWRWERGGAGVEGRRVAAWSRKEWTTGPGVG